MPKPKFHRAQHAENAVDLDGGAPAGGLLGADMQRPIHPGERGALVFAKGDELVGGEIFRLAGDAVAAQVVC